MKTNENRQTDTCGYLRGQRKLKDYGTTEINIEK